MLCGGRARNLHPRSLSDLCAAPSTSLTSSARTVAAADWRCPCTVYKIHPVNIDLERIAFRRQNFSIGRRSQRGEEYHGSRIERKNGACPWSGRRAWLRHSDDAG